MGVRLVVRPISVASWTHCTDHHTDDDTKKRIHYVLSSTPRAESWFCMRSAFVLCDDSLRTSVLFKYGK